jgi:5-methyltetrahydrofolate--homocysteine methyltransferase
MSILDLIQKDFILIDGAMGTMLQKAGLRPGQLPEQMNLTDEKIIIDIHKMYLEAGADVISANTFGANAKKLKKAGLEQNEVIKSALLNARSAISSSGKQAYIAYDAGSIGMLLEPLGTLSFEDAYEMFKSQAILAQRYGADLILIETMSDIAEMRAALLAFKENCNLPVICSMTFDQNKRTLTGTDPETTVHILQGLGADAIGANCSLGPAELYPVIDMITSTCKVPVIVQPNAGLPVYSDGTARFTCGVDEFVFHMERLVDLGVTIIGGCCGTDPQYTAATRQMLDKKSFYRTLPDHRAAVCSPSQTINIDKGITIVGERINPTGNKQFKLALKDGDLDRAVLEALEQKKHGAQILDVNVSLPGIDEVSILKKLALELAYIVNLPLQFDSINPEAVEAALRVYPGKAIINSVSGKKDSLETILPIAKKYGALLVCLCMDDDGIPAKYDDRVRVAEKIINCAAAHGISKDDLLMDCLVLTASAQQREVLETLKAITLLKTKYNVKTILGVSNVSYGLPRRELLNSTYLAMALYAGLDAAIIDPTSTAYMDTIRAFSVLGAIDKDAGSFIKHYGKVQSIPQPVLNDETPEHNITSLILEGNKSGLKDAVKSLSSKAKPVSIIEEHIVPSLKAIGQLYETGQIFLPQLIRAAETSSIAFAEVKLLLADKAESALHKGTIALATVKGDVHDIGKNLVKVVLESFGYDVIDLGKDTHPKTVSDAVLKNNIKLVGLSALMTTTLSAMEQTIKLIRNTSPQCAIMVGGAVLTEQYAKKIGADYYCKDALSGVKAAEDVFGEKC